MLDHSVTSILPLLLTFFCDLIVLLPLLLIWLPELLGRQASEAQEGLPDGATEAPYCPACASERDESARAYRSPPPRIEQQRGRPHEVDTGKHYCPNQDCQYCGGVGRGNLRANGHPNGGHWRQLECVVCQRYYFMETTGTLFCGKLTPPETIWRALKALAEGLGIRATARVFAVDPNTVESWLREAAEHMAAVSSYWLHDLQLTQVQIDELWVLLGKRALDENQEKCKATRLAGK